ncbi:MAG: DUF6364 family protein [Ginsengibacter sp.]
MNTKLTLSLDKEVIERARKVAKSNGRTLSNLVESQLKLLMKDSNTDEIHPEIKRLMGKIHLPSNFNHKTEIKRIMAKKKKYD